MAENPEPLIRVMALHALAYCPRLFYLEEVEEIRLADSSVYAGRTLHEELKQQEEETGEWTSLELGSEKLGLVGKVDCLRKANGSLIPYEHKKGRVRREGKECHAWPPDALQVCAYGMLLEEEIGQRVCEGRIRYHESNVTVRVPLDDENRKRVVDAEALARKLRKLTQRPPVAENDRLCIKCSLSPVCLPEEERLIKNRSWEPVRLFPSDCERLTMHVIEPEACISRSRESLLVKKGGKELLITPVQEIETLVLHGYPQITTQAVHLCARHGITIHWLSAGNRYITGLASPAGAVQRRIRQYKALSNKKTCTELARRLSMAKVEGALRYILRATRGWESRGEAVEKSIRTMRSSIKSMDSAKSRNALCGFEGVAGKAYFSALPSLLKNDLPQELRFSGRSRRPPKDRFNALLGFGYSLLYQAVFQAIVSVGLEPALGFFHQPRSSAHPLVLDLMELFRVSLWDMVVIGSLNRKQWDPAADFNVTQGRVWLSDNGRKKAVKLFEERLSQTWRHPVVKYSLSYARLLELEVRLLEKEWSGSPGLFARIRLR